MRRLLAALCAACLVACVAAPALGDCRPTPRRFEMCVSLGHWDRDDYGTGVVYSALAEIRRAGVPTRVVPAGTPGELYVAPATYPDDSLAGYFDRDYWQLFVNVAPHADRAEVVTTLTHEMLHSLGLRHICRYAHERADDCSPVGYGPAIMNPQMHYVAMAISRAADGTMTVTVDRSAAITAMTDLDRAELRRARDAWRRGADVWDPDYPASGPEESPQ